MLLDGIISHKAGAFAECFKNITSTESYFAEHFPRRHVVPGVVILTMVADTCEYLLKDDAEALGQERRLMFKRLVNGRFRKMVEPGDQCVMKAKVKQLERQGDGGTMTATVAVYANDNRVAQVDLAFDIVASRRQVGYVQAV